MTFLGTDNTAVAGRKLSKARVAMPLIKAFFGQSVAGNTANNTAIREPDGLPQILVEAQSILFVKQGVADRISQLGPHFSQISVPLTHGQIPSN